LDLRIDGAVRFYVLAVCETLGAHVVELTLGGSQRRRG
jgi:hypothetical protein